MRQIVLDTETTGLDPKEGHRIIEIGCVELIGRRRTGEDFHQYLQPDREIDQGALAVHGIDQEFLAEQPRFADIVDRFLAYIQGAELIIHNAPFDVGFLNYELSLLNRDSLQIGGLCQVTDTLIMARRLHPGQRNSLDALCKRYGVDASERELHGALLDARILSDVYLAMTGGQSSLRFDEKKSLHGVSGDSNTKIERMDPGRRPCCVQRATDEELAAHRAFITQMREKGACLWTEE